MLPHDQMYYHLIARYATKIPKQKKVASYIVEKEKRLNQAETVPGANIQEALKMLLDTKRNLKVMKDQYDPIEVEKGWDQWWTESNFFHANNTTPNPKRFIICLPPPNVTGYLHIGHALTVAIEDSLARFKRMSGFQTLYIPGTDHAGIATQAVVEKMLMKETGQSRHDLGREQFIKKVWEWKEKHGSGILNQLRRVGASLDWKREVFTMDEHRSKAVTEAFVRLYEKKLIYRANKLINWSTILKTAISDIQVEYIDLEERTLLVVPGYTQKIQFGVIIEFAYKLKDHPDQQIIVATTRIETMLGDTAVAVHPQDPRYSALVGKQLVHPFIPNRTLKIVTDTFVEKQFGTGAVKITPAHDPNDYSCGKRLGLEFINIFTEDGLINENGGKFTGMKRFACRKAIEEQLKKIGLWRNKKPNKMRLGVCSRSKDVIEPIIKPQWYIDCSEISKPMMEVVKTKELRIIPEQEQQTWYRWIGNLKDWCISRQLWWGHQIPAYLFYKKGGEKPTGQLSESWIAARNIDEARTKAATILGVTEDQIQLKRDQDVLDTWFSSGLFPFSPLQWPNEEHDDYKTFFPNTILETGHDILFFWVARMVMMSLWLTGKLPFKEVLLHPLVCDAEGEKMSKSKGNVIDPIEIIEGTSLDNLIAKVRDSQLTKGKQDEYVKKLRTEFPEGISECGSDALRFGLLSYMAQSRSINLNIKRIVGYRKFCNKIWNTFKFVIAKFEFLGEFDGSDMDPLKQNFLNSWILGKLQVLISKVNHGFNTYNLAEAANSFYNFWLYQLCDVYLEATKPVFISGSVEDKTATARILFLCLERGLRVLHPMMPFISEELYQKLPTFPTKFQTICKAAYPQSIAVTYPNCINHFTRIDTDFEIVNRCAGALRSIAAAYNLPPHIRPIAYIIPNNTILAEQRDLLSTLARCSKVNVVESEKGLPHGCGAHHYELNKLYLQLGTHIDAKKEIERLDKKYNELQGYKTNLINKIAGQDQAKIPEKVKLKNEEQLQGYAAEQKILLDSIERIKALL